MVLLNLTRNEADWLFDILMMHEADGAEEASKIMDKLGRVKKGWRQERINANKRKNID